MQNPPECDCANDYTNDAFVASYKLYHKNNDLSFVLKTIAKSSCQAWECVYIFERVLEGAIVNKREDFR
jgi:hypothetical protein